MDLRIDPARTDLPQTGILVRAKATDGSWDSVDIVALDTESLLTWLRSRGDVSPWAEQTVMLLLGHDREALKVVFDGLPMTDPNGKGVVQVRILASIDDVLQGLNAPKGEDETHTAFAVRQIKVEAVQNIRDLISEGIF